MQPPKITEISKKLIGMSISMSWSNDKSREIWQGFRPRIKEIRNTLQTGLFDIKINEVLMNSLIEFEKCAAVEVSDFSDVPEGMKTYSLSGTYAVFIHSGTANEIMKTFEYIFIEWLPNSVYELDNRERFEILPYNYNPTDKNMKEEIWIPVKKVAE
jgi:AraC family transcriptional regulator